MKRRSRATYTSLDPASLKLTEDTPTKATMDDFIQEWKLFKQLQPELKAALKANDIRSAKKVAQLPALLALIGLAFNSEDEKTKLAALKELLSIGGHSGVSKQAIGVIGADLTDNEIDAKINSLLKLVSREKE